MKPGSQLRIKLTEQQADNLQRHIDDLPFKISYQEEQHGPNLVVVIGCTLSQEKTVREMLRNAGAAVELEAREWE